MATVIDPWGIPHFDVAQNKIELLIETENCLIWIVFKLLKTNFQIFLHIDLIYNIIMLNR